MVLTFPKETQAELYPFRMSERVGIMGGLYHDFS